jgi:PelA/Pel-15E family pectate lyase
MHRRRGQIASVVLFLVLMSGAPGLLAQESNQEEDAALRREALAALHKAAAFYRTKVASHGGYVYYYSLDLQKRRGEGEATLDEIWVQPPGTPTVGMAYLKAYEATQDPYFLDAAREAAEALVYGQLQSGGWTNCVDFDPRGPRVAQYRNGKGRGKNNSTLDDGISQAALRFLARADKALGFRHAAIHESAQFALEALLQAQYPNGAFPQVWTKPVSPFPAIKASYPDYDWRTEGRVKNYWDMYTLNDNVAGSVTAALVDAHVIYQDPRCAAALARLGDFLILAQMPDPQPAWAQQYSHEMHPIWARKFEPPAVSGSESQDVMKALLAISRHTGNEKYLEPIPRALEYLRRSLLSDGRLARYYELKTNRPLYMKRRGDVYTLTYDDSDLPKHYGWKVASRLDEIEKEYRSLKDRGGPAAKGPGGPDLAQQARQVIRHLDDQGRWISTYGGEPLVGQPKFPLNAPYISSGVFSRNVELLSQYLAATK